MTTVKGLPGQKSAVQAYRDLTSDEIIARTRAIAQTLVPRQAETEQRTFYAEDTHEDFSRSGLYRILVPRRYGGYEFGVDTFFRVVMALARGCPSTAWMYCLGVTHALPAATFFNERAQDEMFKSGEFICPATIVPSGTARRESDGTWAISGTWKYCSGSPYATHFIGHALVPGPPDQPPRTVMFILPRDQWQRLDDWGQQLGLRGSGSHSISVADARVPADFVLEDFHLSQVSVDGGTPGLELHGSPQYGGGPASYMVLEITSLAVGIAQGALDAYEDLMRDRTTLFPPIVARAQNPDFQFWYAEAAGMIGAAEAAVLNAIQQWSDICAEGSGFTREQDLRITLICRHVVKLCWHAVERYLFPTAGSSSARHGERIERVWRDLSMLHSHAGFAVFLPSLAAREYTATRFGLVEPAGREAEPEALHDVHS